jgi:cytochrome c oxidase cbb3-type subunit 4
MDNNDIGSILTVLGLLCFLGIVFWAYSGRRRKAFDEAARIPLEDDLPDEVRPQDEPGRTPKPGR